ncbi:DUF2127 domain-containing protein [Actinoalloteichus hymeniacidonis]|uniref:Membrane protein (DUF2127) n=1 Tax=Actinoalloteichus hymeniacidonis TaxID=340345 RepID=A0AAC9MYT1_9PSEU|nr:DUF2127 domain-containing protein [Actinoalloteichus hymeniacidonis]AOS64678.1 putative membrane protein (DUF2127) [Actinoalloteichus hymeniacidonis]MBB5907247.1 putative membrane protein [Actinoalloteichus hymeniacidonis]
MIRWPGFATGADTLTSGSRAFVVVLLIVHGVPKIILVVALLRRWLPAYPISVLVLGAFVVYQVVRAAHTGSVALIVLTVIDLVVIALIVREYRYLRARRAASRLRRRDRK